MHSIHTGSKTSATCRSTVIAHLVKWFIQVVSRIASGIELVPKIYILKAKHPLILGIPPHRQIRLLTDHTGSVAMNRAMLDEIKLRRLFNGIASSPITVFVEKKHWSADNCIFGMRIQKSCFLFKSGRK